MNSLTEHLSTQLARYLFVHALETTRLTIMVKFKKRDGGWYTSVAKSCLDCTGPDPWFDCFAEAFGLGPPGCGGLAEPPLVLDQGQVKVHTADDRYIWLVVP